MLPHMMSRLALALPLLLLPLAGCAESPGTAATVGQDDDLFLSGVVVTEAIVPIANASVSLRPGDLSVLTDFLGQFSLGPVDAGVYRLVVEADGYADTIVEAAASEELVKVVLKNVRTDVPYSEVLKFEGFIECNYALWVSPYQILEAPCVGLVDLVTGTTVSRDHWQFVWDVAAPGLAGALIEMVWNTQPTGKTMGMLLRNVAGAGSGVDAGGTNVDMQFGSTQGPSPLRMRLLQGIENPGADDGAAFQVPHNETMSYKLLILGRADRSQPASAEVLVNHNAQIFITKFFHVMGDESYTFLDQS